MHLGDTNDSRFQRIGLTRHQRLQPDHGMRHHKTGIDGGVGHGGMSAAPGYGHVETIERRQGRPWTHRRLADRNQRHVMERIDLVAGKALEQPVLDHRPPAAEPFLRRLENHNGGAREIARPCQIFGRSQQHDGMAIMTAAMKAPRNFRAPWAIASLVHRQRIHIGTQPARVHAVRNHRQSRR